MTLAMYKNECKVKNNKYQKYDTHFKPLHNNSV